MLDDGKLSEDICRHGLVGVIEQYRAEINRLRNQDSEKYKEAIQKCLGLINHDEHPLLCKIRDILSEVIC